MRSELLDWMELGIGMVGECGGKGKEREREREREKEEAGRKREEVDGKKEASERRSQPPMESGMFPACSAPSEARPIPIDASDVSAEVSSCVSVERTSVQGLAQRTTEGQKNSSEGRRRRLDDRESREKGSASKQSSCTRSLRSKAAAGSSRETERSRAISRRERERARAIRARGKRASSFSLRSSEERRRRRRCLDSLSLLSAARSGLGRLARAQIAIPGLLTGRHLSRAGRKKRERGAEESDAGVHALFFEFCVWRVERERGEEEKKNIADDDNALDSALSLLAPQNSQQVSSFEC